ncbi:MAG: hypothetical protein ACI9EF_001393 [Pseudohongiellaceae bacterium]|jgi:hypothetical protein
MCGMAWITLLAQSGRAKRDPPATMPAASRQPPATSPANYGEDFARTAATISIVVDMTVDTDRTWFQMRRGIVSELICQAPQGLANGLGVQRRRETPPTCIAL